MEKEKVRFCIPDCKFLKPTEEEQNNTPGTVVHFCHKFSLPVYHGKYHPKLMRHYRCDLEIETISTQAQII